MLNPPERLKRLLKFIKLLKMRQIAKKCICILFLLLFSLAYLYAVSPQNITLGIQGNGSPNFVEGFKYALIVEAKAAGYQVADDLNAAKYGIKFTVEFDPMEQKSKFVVSLVKVADSSVIVTMEYFFADEEEMMLYSQLVFFLLMSNLPEDVAAVAPEDGTWRDKWLYLNTSFDYSLMFMALKSDDLKAGIGMYAGDFDNPTRIAPLDNKINPIIGIGLGLEFQFLNFMSIEPHAQIFREEVLLDNIIYNALFSVQLKFPLKFFKSFVIAPYGAVAYSMRFPEDQDDEDFVDIFSNYPEFIFGGGIEVAVKAGKSGAIFFDVSYMYVNNDLLMKNQFDPLYPNPPEIHYDNFNIGFRVGYKIGFFNKKR